jgi:hypothetical protein
VNTGVPVYFCDPRSPWQRGSSENTIGLLRQYFPQCTEIAHFTQFDLDDVAAELNDRPRQTLGWKSPSQALDEGLRLPPDLAAFCIVTSPPKSLRSEPAIWDGAGDTSGRVFGG